ncbi:MAG TPA: hypothetical protein VGZ22_27640 [Isosphaeraceae bacterium]|nr:hypothetical protein [Isosphaeraceae bacterium]
MDPSRRKSGQAPLTVRSLMLGVGFVAVLLGVATAAIRSPDWLFWSMILTMIVAFCGFYLLMTCWFWLLRKVAPRAGSSLKVQAISFAIIIILPVVIYVAFAIINWLSTEADLTGPMVQPV